MNLSDLPLPWFTWQVPDRVSYPNRWEEEAVNLQDVIGVWAERVEILFLKRECVPGYEVCLAEKGRMASWGTFMTETQYQSFLAALAEVTQTNKDQ